MAGQIDQLRQAGFSNDEIGAWTTQKRNELSTAGFADDEIDGYFAGPKPTDVPPALAERFESGAVARKREGGLLQTIPQFADMMISPDGRTKLWEAIKSYPAEFAKGMLEQGQLPGEVAKGNVDLTTSEGLDKAIGLGTLVGFGRPNKLPLTGKTSGMSMVAGDQMARMERGPTGEIYEEPIGGLPQAQDFSDAAVGVAGPQPLAHVEPKLRTLWEDHGIHPAEAAHDAARDPVVAQSLLSSGDDLPEVYTKPQTMAAAAKQDVIKGEVGESGGAPPKETTADLPPGSLAEAERTVLDKISIGGQDPAHKWSWQKLYTQTVDDLAPIKTASPEAYQLARLTRGQFGKAEQFLEHGTFDFDTYKTTGPSLKEILAPVRDDLDGLRAYLASKRAIEIEATDRKSGIDLVAAQKVADESASKYEKIAAQLGEYQTASLKYLKDSGVLKESSFEAMQEANKNFVPFFRVMEEWRKDQGGKVGRSLGPGSPIKALKGSERDIIDPLESIIKNTYAYISVAERNAAGIKLIDALNDGHIADVVTRAPRDAIDVKIARQLEDSGIKDPGDDLVGVVRSMMPEEGNTISAFRNGVKETAHVTDPDLLTAFRGMDQQSAAMITKILAVPARTLRAGAVLTPEFMAKNLVRDFSTAFVNTKGALFSPIDTAKGLKSVITKDADFQTWLKSGGANATMVALDRRYLQEDLASLTAKTGLMDRAWNVVKSPFHALRMMTELAENATRLGEFKKALKGSTDKADIQSAGFASREVTLDFARIGASMRAYNMITAFANATIQGTDRVVRAFRDDPVKTSARVAVGVTLPSVLLWFANHDDPRYKELPQWQKDLFWIVLTKDHIWRIPKNFELGIIFGSGAERVLEATLGNNPDAFKGFAKSVRDAMLPSAIPTFMLPMVEQFANRSTFVDRTLIPYGAEKMLPEYQYTPYTTELTKTLGKIIGGFPGVREASLDQGDSLVGGAARAVTSPILMENYIRAWTGGLGSYALNAADTALRKAGALPDPVKPTATLADIPFIKAFAVRYPSASAQSIQDFHDEYDRSKRFYDTWMAMAKEGDVAAVQRIQAIGGPAMFARLDGINKTLNEHNKLIRDVYKAPDVKPDEKRQIIDQLYYSMIQLGQYGKSALRQIQSATMAPVLQ